MANTVLLNAVSTNTVSSGQSTTGEASIKATGLLHTETIGVEIAPTDTESQYRVIAQMSGPDPKPMVISDPATYYVRLRLYGVAANRSGTVTAWVCQ